MSTPSPLPSSPPQLDPPFRGYVETTYDSLLVFEAARRGMIPRVTRRLIERERGMVQSGAVFVFDEQESGIKRWTDGLVWSPSRILGNFLVYRETDKRPANPSATSSGLSHSPNQVSPSGTPSTSMAPPNHFYAESSHLALASAQQSNVGVSGGEIPILAQGAIRPRSISEGGMDRQRERQLVGSLTNSYKFREGGLVKKTMSVNIGNYSQHMISYYTVEDVMSGKLRTPSTIPELAALEISMDYLQKQNFRFPPLVEIGLDGVPRYRGEAEEPMSPSTPMTGLSMHSFPTPPDMYDAYAAHPQPPGSAHGQGLHLQMEPPRHTHAHSRAITHPQHIPIPLPSPLGHPHAGLGISLHGQTLSPPAYMPNSALGVVGHYFDPAYSSSAPSGSSAQPIPIQRQVSAGGGPMRPSSSSPARYDPYGTVASPRVVTLGTSPGSYGHGNGHGHGQGPTSAGLSSSFHRRQSGPHHQTQHQQQQQDYYQQYDIKPIINASGNAQYAYQPQPPASAPGSFTDYNNHGRFNHDSGSTPTPTATPGPHSALVQIASPIIAYTPTSTSVGQQYNPHSHSNWHTAPPPPPGSQSRLLPAHSREYTRSPMPPPSSSGPEVGGGPMSGSGTAGGGGFAYVVPPLPHQHQTPTHWDPNHPSGQSQGQGQNTVSGNTGPGMAHTANPPGSAGSSQLLGSGAGHGAGMGMRVGMGLGGMDMAQYVADEWTNSSVA